MEQMQILNMTKRAFTDLSTEEIQKIVNFIKFGTKSYRSIVDEFNLKNVWLVNFIKKKYLLDDGKDQPARRRPIKESTKKKIQRSAIAAAQIKHHGVVAGRELSLLDGILFNINHLIDIINFHDDKTTEAIKTLQSVYELLLEKHKPDSVAETKKKVYVLGQVEDMLTKLSTYIQAHQTQIKAIAEIRQQSDHFVKHRDMIIGREGLIQMIDDIFYCIAQFDEPSYNKFRESIQKRSPLAFGLLTKMEANVLNEPEAGAAEVSLDSNQQDNRLPE